MNQHTHTPGPWGFVEAALNAIDIHAADLVIASVEAENELEPMDWANARLIAAAPELLEMLRRTLPTMDDALQDARMATKTNPDYQSVVNAFDRQIAGIRAAIAKATGGQELADANEEAQPLERPTYPHDWARRNP